MGNQNLLAIQADVKNFENEEQAVKQIVDKFGKLDVVIANAGLGKFAPVDELTLEDWNAMIDTNLKGAFHTLKAAVEQLKQNKGYYISFHW